MNNLAKGLIAGSAGTVTLNLLTYLDIAGRGRAPSEVPAEVVETVGEKVGVPLGGDKDVVQNRKSGLGALLGYATGLSFGALYGVVGPHASRLPLLVAGVLTGVGAMAASDVPAAALGVTDPREWGPIGFAADVVPHIGYGLTTAAVFRGLSSAA